LFAVAALLSALAFLTGAPAEITLHGVPGMSESLVEQHRYAARLAVSVTALLGLVGISAIRSMRQGRAVSRKLLALCLCTSLAAVAATGWAVYSGIRVQNSEIRALYLPENSGTGY
jgi:hypothetical protein